MQKILRQIAAELRVQERQVQAAVELLDGGASVPFIARYRKEATGGLDDIHLRELEARLVEVIQAQPDAGLAEEMLDDEVADEPSPEAMVEQQVEGGMNNSVAATTDSAQQLS